MQPVCKTHNIEMQSRIQQTFESTLLFHVIFNLQQSTGWIVSDVLKRNIINLYASALSLEGISKCLFKMVDRSLSRYSLSLINERALIHRS